MSIAHKIEFDYKIKYEMKNLLFGLIITLIVAISFIHLLLFFTNEERYIGTTSAVLLGSSTCILLLIIFSNRRKVEVQKFKLLFIGVILWCIGEFSYTYYQIVLNVDVPYPSIGEIFFSMGYVPLILFAYKSFKQINKDGLIKTKLIVLVFTIASIVPIISTIQIFNEGVDFQLEWIDIMLSGIYNYSDIALLSFSILILIHLPRNNPYTYHWLLFTSFLILTTVTDFIYIYLSLVDEEFLLATELIWEAMWAFSYLSILASLFWYYKLINILNKNPENTLINYGKKYSQDISIKDQGKILEETSLTRENVHDFELVEKFIDKVIKEAKDEITILFPNLNTMKRKEIDSILKILMKKTNSNISVRILFPLGVNDRIFTSYRDISNVRIFERKLDSDEIIIVSDFNKALLLSNTYTKDEDGETTYIVTYSENEKINYAYVTQFEQIWLLQTVLRLEIK